LGQSKAICQSLSRYLLPAPRFADAIHHKFDPHQRDP
jgi:hypothetical protein